MGEDRTLPGEATRLIARGRETESMQYVPNISVRAETSLRHCLIESQKRAGFRGFMKEKPKLVTLISLLGGFLGLLAIQYFLTASPLNNSG